MRAPWPTVLRIARRIVKKYGEKSFYKARASFVKRGAKQRPLGEGMLLSEIILTGKSVMVDFFAN